MSRIFGEIRQIAFVVRDMEKALRYWNDTLGVGPFYLLRDLVPDNYRYRGQPAPAPRITIALGYSGDVQVELIQQHDDKPSAYLDYLQSGREGFQHVSSWMTRPEYDEAVARLLRSGVQLAHEGAVPGSGIRFVYFATETAAGGFVYEISEAREPAIYEFMLKICDVSRSWDGKNGIRDWPPK